MWSSDHQTCTSSIYGLSEETRTLLNTNPKFPSLYSDASPSPPLRHHCIATIKGQNSYTSALVLTGEHLFTGSSDGQIRRNNLSSLADNESLVDETMVVAGEGAVKALVASSDKLITAHQDHKIRVWRVDHTAHNQQQRITQLATLPTLSDRAIKLLLPKNHVHVRRHKKCTWIHHVDAVSALVTLEATLVKHKAGVNTLAMSTDGTVLYSGASDRTICVWTDDGAGRMEAVVRLKGHSKAILCLATVADMVCSGSADKV